MGVVVTTIFGSCGRCVVPRLRESKKFDCLKRLWMKVLVRAILDATATRNSEWVVSTKDQRTARVWIFEESNCDFNSFENVCAYLGFDAERIRSRLRQKNISEIRHRILTFDKGRTIGTDEEANPLFVDLSQLEDLGCPSA